MTGSWFKGLVRGARIRRGTLAILLAVSVLVCHGLYGAFHQVHAFGVEAPGHAAPHVQNHQATHAVHGGIDQGEGHAGHPGGMAYAAVLGAALLAAAFAVALGGPRLGPRAALVADPGRRYPPSFLRPARGGWPLPALQVFRL